MLRYDLNLATTKTELIANVRRVAAADEGREWGRGQEREDGQIG